VLAPVDGFALADHGLDWTDDRRLFYYADSNSGRVPVRGLTVGLA